MSDLPGSVSGLPTEAETLLLTAAAPSSAGSPAALFDRLAPTERYELGAEIARGGMGAVHHCRDRQLGRDLAVKVLLADLADRPDVVRRFIEEAQVGGQLQHPGIVPVHELGKLPDGRPFFTMKLVKGQTLAALLSERADPRANLPRFLKIFEQVCQTLAYAHARKVIHRDLKPANVMVGAFGEVQVMDWGLAKVLGPASPRSLEPVSQTNSVIDTGRSDDPAAHTVAGSVLGTFAYMPPEQARGQTERVDERGDVFGLGGLLCEILTGRPPYSAATANEVRYQSQAVDLGPARERLNHCGAEPELIELARQCLAAEPNERPRDAGVVAAAVTAYLAGVAERLRQAEIDRAAAQERARAARAKLRLTVALAASVFAAVGLAGGGWAWLHEQHRARVEQTVRQASQALGQALTLNGQAAAVALIDLDRWREAESLHKEALAAAEQAESTVTAGEADEATRRQLGELLPRLRAEAEAASRDRAMLERLENIRYAANDAVTDADFDRYLIEHGNEDRFIYSQAAGTSEYVRAFRDYGIDVDQGSIEPIAEAIGKSRIRAELVAALDDWLRLTDDRPGRERLLQISRAADPDRLRDRLRAALAGLNLAALEQLAAVPEAVALPASSVLLLADALFKTERVGPAIALLRQAQRLHAGDFWLNNKLGEYLMYSGGTTPARMEEAMRFFTAALVLRPQSQTARVNLADALAYVGAHEEAEAAYRQALEQQPGLAYVRIKLAAALAVNGRYDEALDESRRAVAQRPDSAFIHEGHGGVCFMIARYSEAETAYREAIKLRPGIGSYHSGLGQALAEQDRYLEAVRAHREAVRLKPSALTFAKLANTLVKRGEIAEALAAARQAVALQPGASVGLSSLAAALAADGQKRQAIDTYREAISLTPRDSGLWWRLGNQLYSENQYDEAAAAILEAIRRGPEQGPRLAVMYNELGLIRHDLGQFAQAVAAYRKALDLKPADAVTWANLGDTLGKQERWTGALDAFSHAVCLDGADHDHRVKLADAMERLGLIDEAIALWTSAPPNDRALHRHAKLCQDHDRHAEAIALLKPWLEKHVDDSAAWHRLGVSLARTGRLDDAVTALEKALTGKPSLLLKYPRASLDFGNALLERSRRLDQEGHSDEARVEAARGHAYRAWGLNGSGKPFAAVEECRRAILLTPVQPKYHRLLAQCLKRTHPVEAVAAYCTMLAHEPLDFATYQSLGELLWELERPAEAMTAFQIILARDGNDSKAHRGLGQVLMETGRLAEALAHLEKSGDEPLLGRCQRLLKLEAEESSFFGPEARPRDQDLLDLATLCRYQGRSAAAARFFIAASDARLLKAESAAFHRAVQTAALAGCGRGDDADGLTEAERKALRGRALDWLRVELAALLKSLTVEDAKAPVNVFAVLGGWQRETALAGVRDPEALPAAEWAAWRAFWSEVDSLRLLARSKVP